MSNAAGRWTLASLQTRLSRFLSVGTWWGWRVIGRLAVVITAVATFGILAYAFLISNPWRDGDAYLNAALRVRYGLSLYPELSDAHVADVYRYAPWFAYAWVPLSYLPREVIIPIWQAAMLACSALAIIPAWRAGLLGQAIVVIVVPFLVMASLIGNVQPAIVALLVHTIRGRAGPFAIAIAASLKAVPILFVITYLARRQWWSALIAMSLTALLWLHALLFGVANYPAEIGETTGLYTFSPALWLAVMVVVGGIAYLVARRPGPWYASSLLVTLAPPRFIAYDWTFMLVGAASDPRGDVAAGAEPDKMTARPS